MPSLRIPVYLVQRGRQRGAALFVAMMMLILLSLLAISASQVTTLQEKMVQSYWADILAFESTEERIRNIEKDLRAQAMVEECPNIEDTIVPSWASSTAVPSSAGTHVRNASYGFGSRGSGIVTSLAMVGQDASNCAYFLMTATENDVRNAADARSWAVVQSFFVP